MDGNKLTLLPPAPEKCQCCAIVHAPEQPHDATSLFYAFWFHEQHGRSPTWNDAIAHCDAQTQAFWVKYLTKIGIDPASTNKKGDIKSQTDLTDRLNKK